MRLALALLIACTAAHARAAVIEGQVRTPLHEPRSNTGNLKGITRGLVGELCHNLGLTYKELPLFPADIGKATECFVSSATREVMPVARVLLPGGEKKEFPKGGGEITKALQKEYGRYVRAYTDSRRSGAWF